MPVKVGPEPGVGFCADQDHMAAQQKKADATAAQRKAKKAKRTEETRQGNVFVDAFETNKAKGISSSKLGAKAKIDYSDFDAVAKDLEDRTQKLREKHANDDKARKEADAAAKMPADGPTKRHITFRRSMHLAGPNIKWKRPFRGADTFLDESRPRPRRGVFSVETSTAAATRVFSVETSRGRAAAAAWGRPWRRLTVGPRPRRGVFRGDESR